MRFGERLREIRKERGISQRDLAAMAGIDWTYISKLESGSMAPPSTSTIHRIAQALDTDERELICLSGKVPNGLKAMLKENPVLAELVWTLSKRVLPDETYQQMIELALQVKESEKDLC